MTDTYTCFKALARKHIEGHDYSRIYRSGASGILIMAPHGGRIEFQTAPLARRVAGDEHALYCFEGRMPSGNRCLHITSTNFDEPIALAAVDTAEYAVAIHGVVENDAEWTMVGGLANELRNSIEHALLEAGFHVQPHDGRRAGINRANICNRALNFGVQLELSAALRTAFRNNKDLMQRYAETVQAGLATIVSQPV